MRGLVFTCFVDMVEKRFGLQTMEDIFQEVQPESEGAYTTVGDYDHREMLALVACLCHKKEMDKSQVLTALGEEMFKYLTEMQPTMMEGALGSFDFLERVDGIVQVELRKLHDGTDMPRFSCERPGGDKLILDYNSKAPFAALVEGAIKGCIRYFEEDIALSRDPAAEYDDTHCRFILQRNWGG